MYRYSRRPEAEANIGAVEAVVVTTDVGSFFSGILSSTESSKPRFTDWTEGQIGDLTDEDISGLDETSSPDLTLLKDIFLLDPDNRKRMSNRQRLAVERSLNVREDSGTDYEVSKSQLVSKLHEITRYQLMFDARLDQGAKNFELISRLSEEPDQILGVLRSIREEDIERRTISGNAETLGSYIYVAKPTRELELRTPKGGTVIRKVDLFIRVVDGHADDSSIIVISFRENEQAVSDQRRSG